MTRESATDGIDRFLFDLLANGAVLLAVSIASAAFETMIAHPAFERRSAPGVLKIKPEI
jgi:hypothetical protein